MHDAQEVGLFNALHFIVHNRQGQTRQGGLSKKLRRHIRVKHPEVPR
jgi:hypothetical protein